MSIVMNETTQANRETRSPIESRPDENLANPSVTPTGDPLPVPKTVAVCFILSVLRGVPTLVVLGILAGLAWWGHHHGWKIPKFSELTERENSVEVAWCDAHGVPEADCVSCQPDLMPKGELFGWCKEHGVHECVLHHPQLSQLKEPPDINEDDLRRAADAIAAYPRTKNDSSCKMHLRRIQFPSREAVDRAGVDINLVDRGPVLETIKTTGEIIYDPTRVAHLSSRAKGSIWRVERKVGDQVKQGDLLAIVDAFEVGRIKSQLLKAMAQLELDSQKLDRVTRLGRNVIPEREIQESAAAKSETEFEIESCVYALANLGLPIQLDQVQGRTAAKVSTYLRSLGMPDFAINTSQANSHTANLIPIYSSRDGIVVELHAVAGEVVDTGKSLFTIADTRQMWLQLNVRLEESSRISIGQKVVFRPDGSDLETEGTITWISTDVDRQTRTVRVRAELENGQGRLRNETYGAGEIVLRKVDDAILVPSEAVHWEGCCNVVFVRDRNYFDESSFKVFHTRSVRLGAQMAGNTEIIAGLVPGEVIVTHGGGILRAELLKGNLGAG